MKTTYFTEFLNSLAQQQTDQERRAFFQAILTPKELEEIPKRLQIVKMLKKGLPQRAIAQKLEVGIATVTRGSRELQKGGFKNIE